MATNLQESIARNAASTWCRCFKCDGIINETGQKCDKANLYTCRKWYNGYRTAILAVTDLRIAETIQRRRKDDDCEWSRL